MEIIRLKKGDEFIKEGEIGSEAFLLNSGSMEVSKKVQNDEKMTLAILREGAVLGEMGFLSGKPRSATVTALEDCELTKLYSGGDIDHLLDNPEALMLITKILINRLRATLKILDKANISAR